MCTGHVVVDIEGNERKMQKPGNEGRTNERGKESKNEKRKKGSRRNGRKWKVAGHGYWSAENAPPRGAICKRRFKTGYLRFARLASHTLALVSGCLRRAPRPRCFLDGEAHASGPASASMEKITEHMRPVISPGGKQKEETRRTRNRLIRIYI